MFLFFPDCFYYCSNHTFHHVYAIGNQSLEILQDGLNADGVFPCYYLGLIKTTLWHIHSMFQKSNPALNEHDPQYSNSIIVVRFIVSCAHLCAFSMSYYVQCWDCCQYFLMHCIW
jgi:hypothetical protein